MNKGLTFIELFAGAGGLSEGFINAGYQPIAFVEMNKFACDSLKTRIAYHFLKEQNKLELYFDYLKGDITQNRLYSFVPENFLNSVINKEISDYTIVDIFEQIKNQMAEQGIEKVNVLLGGPPCQSYSIIGRVVDKNNMENDSRNYLYKYYIRFLKEFKPDIFIFENVPGILSAGKGKYFKDILEQIRNAGYTVEYKKLNAHDFGVLQNRKRIIIIGWRSELDLNYPEFEKDKEIEKYTVADVLSDLPAINAVEEYKGFEYAGEPSEYLKRYNIRNETDILTLHLARKTNEKYKLFYKFYIRKYNEKKERPKFANLPVKGKLENGKTVFQNRFRVISNDLSFCYTVFSDKHTFIHPDINQLRSLSVREFSRLQSFPDNYFFEGPKTWKFKQIANAVPPLMSKQFALKLNEMLK